MFLKFYHHLHPLHETKSSFAITDDEDDNLDIFEMVAGIKELANKLMNRKLMIFCKFQVDAKDINCHLKLWPKHESMFPNVGFLGEQILRVISFQKETKKIVSFASIVSNLKTC